MQSSAPDVDTIPTAPLAAPPLAAAFPAPAAVALLLPRLQMARVTAAAVKVTTRVLQLLDQCIYMDIGYSIFTIFFLTEST